MTAASAHARAVQVADVDLAVARGDLRAALLAAIGTGDRVLDGVCRAVSSQTGASYDALRAAACGLVARGQLVADEFAGRAVVRRVG